MSTADAISDPRSSDDAALNWDVGDVARQFSVSEAAVRKCAQQGLIPAVRLDDDWRFSEAAIRDWQLGRGGRNSTGDYLTQKELLMRWTGAWVGEPPFLIRDPGSDSGDAEVP